MADTFTKAEDLAAMLLARLGAHRLLVAIAGPPGAGKSTFADWLRDTLNAARPGIAEVLPMDGYHYDDLLLVPRGWRPRKGSPHTFDTGGLKAMLERLRRDEEDEIAVPVFDRSIEIARAGARIIPKSTRIVLVEGNYLLLDAPPWPTLLPYFDCTVMLQASEATLNDRLIQRWITHGLTPEERTVKMEGNDLPNVRTVLTGSRPAEIVVDATRALPRKTN